MPIFAFFAAILLPIPVGAATLTNLLTWSFSDLWTKLYSWLFGMLLAYAAALFLIAAVFLVIGNNAKAKDYAEKALTSMLIFGAIGAATGGNAIADVFGGLVPTTLTGDSGKDIVLVINNIAEKLAGWIRPLALASMAVGALLIALDLGEGTGKKRGLAMVIGGTLGIFLVAIRQPIVKFAADIVSPTCPTGTTCATGINAVLEAAKDNIQPLVMTAVLLAIIAGGILVLLGRQEKGFATISSAMLAGFLYFATAPLVNLSETLGSSANIFCDPTTLSVGQTCPTGATASGIQALRNVFWFLSNEALAYVGGIAILAVMIAGAMILTGGMADQGKKLLKSTGLGLLLIAASGVVARLVKTVGLPLSGGNATALKTFIETDAPNLIFSVVGTLGVVMILIAAAMLLSPTPSTHDRGTKLIGATIGGLLLVGLAYAAVRMVADLGIFGSQNIAVKVDGANKSLPIFGGGTAGNIFDPTAGPLAKIAKALLSLVAPLATMGFLVGGAMFVFSTGEDGPYRKGIKLMWYSAGGLVVALLAYAIVRAVTAISF